MRWLMDVFVRRVRARRQLRQCWPRDPLTPSLRELPTWAPGLQSGRSDISEQTLPGRSLRNMWRRIARGSTPTSTTLFIRRKLSTWKLKTEINRQSSFHNSTVFVFPFIFSTTFFKSGISLPTLILSILGIQASWTFPLLKAQPPVLSMQRLTIPLGAEIPSWTSPDIAPGLSPTSVVNIRFSPPANSVWHPVESWVAPFLLKKIPWSQLNQVCIFLSAITVP